MPLGDGAFVGASWNTQPIAKDLPFPLRLQEDRQTTRAALLTTPRKGGSATATLTGLTASLILSARAPKGREPVIPAANRADHDALAPTANAGASR